MFFDVDELVIFLFSLQNKFPPFVIKAEGLLSPIQLDRLVVHFEGSESLYYVLDSEFHHHGDVFHLSDGIKNTLQAFDARNLIISEFLVVLFDLQIDLL